MPNWCNTEIVFFGAKETVNDFHNKLQVWLKDKNLTPSDYFGTDWLGNILYHAFGEKYVTENIEKMDFRCWVNFVDDIEPINDNEYEFRITTESAWEPLIRIWDLILEELYPDKNISFAYIAEEGRTGFYQIYDPLHVIYETNEIYNVYKTDDREDIFGLSDYCDCSVYTKKELIRYIESCFEIKCGEKELADIEALNKKISDYIQKITGDTYCEFIINKYEVL